MFPFLLITLPNNVNRVIQFWTSCFQSAFIFISLHPRSKRQVSGGLLASLKTVFLRVNFSSLSCQCFKQFGLFNCTMLSIPCFVPEVFDLFLWEQQEILTTVLLELPCSWPDVVSLSMMISFQFSLSLYFFFLLFVALQV